MTTSVDVLCQHYDDQRGRCVRLPHGSEIRHRYVGNRDTAAAKVRAESAVLQSRQRRLNFVKIGRFRVGVGDAVGLDSNGTVPHEGRGWLGVLKGAYEKDGTIYAEIIGAKGTRAVKERIVPLARLEYIRPGTEKARKAKIRVGRAV